jgi:hypothetical protein
MNSATTKEDKKFDSQLEQVYQSFHSKPQTMKECDVAIGVMRSNICWYCRTLRRQNLLHVVGKRVCRITKHMANVYTTNPALVPVSNFPQLNLF